MTINLDNLRKIAEAATPGPWEMRDENPQMDGRNFTLRVRDQAGIRMSAHCYGFNGDPEFIATFDPPTVLALLSRLEQAEAQVARVREVIHQYDPKCLTCMCNSDGDCCKCTVAVFQEALDGEPV